MMPPFGSSGLCGRAGKVASRPRSCEITGWLDGGRAKAVEVARQLMIYPSTAARTAEGEPIPGDERIFAEPTREVAEGCPPRERNYHQFIKCLGEMLRRFCILCDILRRGGSESK